MITESTSHTPMPGRRSPRRWWLLSSVVAAALVIVAVAIGARAPSQPDMVRTASEGTCPDAGPVTTLDPEAQQVVDDAENLACVADPTTTSTTELPSTTTTALEPPVTTTIPTPSQVTGTLTGSLDGVDVAVTVQPMDLKAADVLTLDVRATDSDGGELAIGVYWGQPEQPGGAPGPPQLECADVDTYTGPPTEKTRTMRHAYRKPGKYNFAVVVAVGYCGDEPGKELKVPGTAVVGPGPLLSNGPLPAKLDAWARNGEPVLGIQVLEPDGFVDRIEVDWGDGGPVQVVSYPLDDCEDPLTAFPTSVRIEQLTHAYASAGTYDATVIVRSVGCVGGDQQTSSTTVRMAAP